MTIDDQLDEIYDRFDDLMRNGDFQTIDFILCKWQRHIKSTPSDILIGVLTASLPAKSKIPSRPLFFKMVEKHFESKGIDSKCLLDGLK